MCVQQQSRKKKYEWRPYLLAVTQVQISGEEVSRQLVSPSEMYSQLPVTWLSCLSTCFLNQKQDTDFKRQSLPCVSLGHDDLPVCLGQPPRGLHKQYVEQSRVCVDVFWHCFISLSRFTLPIKKGWSSNYHVSFYFCEYLFESNIKVLKESCSISWYITAVGLLLTF